MPNFKWNLQGSSDCQILQNIFEFDAFIPHSTVNGFEWKVIYNENDPLNFKVDTLGAQNILEIKSYTIKKFSLL